MYPVTISTKYHGHPAKFGSSLFKTWAKVMFIPYNSTLRLVVVPSIDKARECSKDSPLKEFGKRRMRTLMNVVDSSGWIEYFVNGRNADFFNSPFATRTIYLSQPFACMKYLSASYWNLAKTKPCKSLALCLWEPSLN